MAVENPGEIQPADDRTESRLELVQYYHRRSLTRLEPSQLVQPPQTVVVAPFGENVPVLGAALRRIAGKTIERPGEPIILGPRYINHSLAGIYSQVLNLLCLSPDQHPTDLIEELKRQCGFSDYDLDHSAIPESKLDLMDQVIEQSRRPLKWSWTEDQALFEIYLATGQKPKNLTEASVAFIDCASVGSKYGKFSNIVAQAWLLDARIPSRDGRFYNLELELRPKGGYDGKPAFYMTADNVSYRGSVSEALDHFKRTQEHFLGTGAEQEVEILKPELLK